MNSSATNGSVRRRGFEDAAADEAPLAARQVLQHQQRERSERQAEAEEKADQPRVDELVDVHDARRSRSATRPMAPTMSARCWSRASAGDVGDDVPCVAISASVLRRFVPGRRRPACASFVGSPPGTSDGAACWLNCSARM